MQSVVTGQAPITLKQKITSGGKTNKKQCHTVGNRIVGTAPSATVGTTISCAHHRLLGGKALQLVASGILRGSLRLCTWLARLWLFLFNIIVFFAEKETMEKLRVVLVEGLFILNLQIFPILFRAFF